MKLAIVSDIHDHVWNLAAALPHLERSDAILCCGDLCSPFVLSQLARGVSAPVHVVFGNNDGDLYRLTETASKHRHVHLHGTFFRGSIAGVDVAMTHYPEVAAAVDANQVDLIAYGHDHVFHLGSRGRAVVVNPGPLLGYLPSESRDAPPTFAVYDVDKREATGFRVTNDGSVTPHNG